MNLERHMKNKQVVEICSLRGDDAIVKSIATARTVVAGVDKSSRTASWANTVKGEYA